MLLKQFKFFRWTMDPILAALLVIALIFFLSFVSKLITRQDSYDKEKRQIDVLSIDKVCLDSNVYTECLDIQAAVYKVYVYKEADITTAHTVLISRK